MLTKQIPGVHVKEIPSGARPIASIATSHTVFSLTAKELPARITTPFRHIDVTDSEVLKGPSVLVAKTLSLRNCRFPQWSDGPTTQAGFRLTGSASDFPQYIWRGIEHLAYLPNTKNVKRKWRPVLCLVARTTSVSGNQGNPFEMARNGHEMPLIVDFSPPEDALSDELDMVSTLPDMLRGKALYFHRKYLEEG